MKVLGENSLNFIGQKYKELKGLLNNKVDKVNGKVLSTHDFDDASKSKVDKIKTLNDERELIYQETSTDFNQLANSGFYRIQSSTNAPHQQNPNWYAIVFRYNGDSNSIAQIALNMTGEDNVFYMRKGSTNPKTPDFSSILWDEWEKLNPIPDLSTIGLEVANENDVRAIRELYFG
ncbi:hypothetical protein HKO22_02800 [Peptoniphilus sp. AGMB00490]|uniref:Uncharacterized protein n=1 Tax=Peptoniphilus faecalis TaxID=2731255 RepID=A0A848RK19_9FIRM|nr:pyocin knob domain-containing protein [Peptoniphilus faecalis]NMW84672.1 hypothetical protein [Peptoniphilus faecalis]